MPSTRDVKAGRAYVELGITDKMTRGLRRASAKLRAFGAQVQRVGLGLVKIGALMSAPFALGIKSFASFQEQMAMVSTMLDEPAKHMPAFEAAIKDMSIAYGQATATLAKGLYDILSASVPAAKALDVLAVSVRAGVAGMTDAGIAADAITTILNAYKLEADEAASVSDWLFTVVKRGKTTFGELAPSIGLVATTAANAGVTLEELGAVAALLTRNGIRTERAVTAINAVVATFLKPTKDAKDAAAELGIELSVAGLKSEGLAAVLAKVAKLPVDTIGRIFPNKRAIRGVLPAVASLADLTGDLAAMAARAGATEAAFKKMSQTLAFQFRRLWRAVVVVFIEIGDAVQKSVSRVVDWIGKATAAIRGWISRNRELVVTIGHIAVIVALTGAALLIFAFAVQAVGYALSGLAAVLGILTTTFAIIKAAILALLTPIGLVIVALAGITAVLFYVSGYFEKVIAYLAAGFKALKDDAIRTWAAIGQALAAGDIPAAAELLWAWLSMIWAAGAAKIESIWLGMTQWIEGAWFDAWRGILAFARLAQHGLLVAAIETSAGILKAWTHLSSWFKTMWEDLKTVAKHAWLEIRALFDESIDTTEGHKKISQERLAAVNKIQEQKNKALDEVRADQKRMRARESREFDKDLADLNRLHREAKERLSAESKAKLAAATAAYEKARAAWEAAVTAVEKKHGGKGISLEPPKPEDFIPPDVQKQLDEITDRVGAAMSGAGKVQLAGGFNVARAGLAAGAPIARVATNTERLVRLTELLVTAVREGGEL